jgi:hypothetical protein
MMNELGKRKNTTEIRVEPNEGERTLLPSSKSGTRSPFLGFLDTSSDNVTEDMVLDYLAHIIADIYLDQTYGNTTDKESSDLLPGINEGTS